MIYDHLLIVTLESAHHSCLVEWHVYTSYFVPVPFIYNCKIINLCSYVEKEGFFLRLRNLFDSSCVCFISSVMASYRKLNSLSEYEDRNLYILSWRALAHSNLLYIVSALIAIHIGVY